MRYKICSCKVSALEINNKVENDGDSVLEGIKYYYSTLAENFVKMLSKTPNKYSINTFIKGYENTILDDHFWQLNSNYSKGSSSFKSS